MYYFQEKPHKCLLCSKSFPTPGDLKSHMYVHTGSWPFKCDICQRGFSKQTNLKNHMQLHINDSERLRSSKSPEFESSSSLNDYWLKMDIHTHNNNKIDLDEVKIKEEQSKECSPKVNNEKHRLFRPIKF